MPDGMAAEKPEEISDGDRLRNWMDSVAGNIYPGVSVLKSVKESKDGDKITVVLKKKKQRKAKKGADKT
jgi:hypothetical protein